jgi:hypothetical protein
MNRNLIAAAKTKNKGTTTKTPTLKKKPATKKKPTKTKTGTAAPPKSRPAPKDQVPPMGQSAGASTVAPMGFPIDQCLTGPVSDLEQSTDDINSVCARMALPSQGTIAPAAPSGTWQKVYAGQSTLTYLVCRGLDRAAGAGFKVDTPVTTTALKQGQQKSWLFFEARRTAALGEQQDAAAFDQAAALLEKGQQPDLQTMQQALRHADRLDSQSDNSLGLSPDQRSATR